MKINYEIHSDDLIQYQIFCHKTIPALRKVYRNNAITYGILSVISLILAIILPKMFLIPFFITTILLWYLLLMNTMFIDILIKNPMQKLIKNGFMSGFMGPRAITLFSEAYVIESTQCGCSTKTDWCRLDVIYITPSHAFLFDGPFMASIIPKRSFGGSNSWESFVALLQTYSDKPVIPNSK